MPRELSPQVADWISALTLAAFLGMLLLVVPA